MKCFFDIVLYLLFNLFNSGGCYWRYPDLSINESFPVWGGLCDKGMHQSPINLSLKNTLQGIFEKPLIGVNYFESISDFIIKNTGHTVELSNFNIKLYLKGGPLNDTYILNQLHFHWWSEHTIDNMRYPFELHLVHRNVKYSNGTESSFHKDGLAVMAVLFHASLHRNEFIDEMIRHVDAIKSHNKINQSVRINSTFAIKDLLPHINEYVTYDGSLTTPTCAESVTWIVIAETFPITIEQIDAFKALEYESGKTLKNNYRFVQNINQRAIVKASNKQLSNGAFSLLHSTYTPIFLFLMQHIKFIAW